MSSPTSPNGGNGGKRKSPCSPGSVLGAALSLAVTTMGAGILTLPAAYANAAIMPASLLLLFVAYLTIVSIDFIVLSIEKLGLNSYEEITQKLLGSFWLEFVRWMLLFYNIGSAVGYLVVLSDLFEPLLFYFNASPIPIVRDTFQTSKHILFFVWLVVIVPVTCVPSLGALHATSFLAISSTCFISFLIVFRYFLPGPEQLGTAPLINNNNNNNNNNNVGSGSGVRYWEGLHPFLALPIIMFSFDCQSLVFQVYASLDDMCRKTMKEVAVISLLVSGSIHAAVGLFGYLSSPLQVRENVISNYNPRTDVLFFVGYCFYAIPIMLAYVIILFPIRDSIFILWYGYSSASIATHVPDFTHLVELEEELNKKLDAAEDEKRQLVHLRIREQFFVSTSSSTTSSSSASENDCDDNDNDNSLNFYNNNHHNHHDEDEVDIEHLPTTRPHKYNHYHEHEQLKMEVGSAATTTAAAENEDKESKKSDGSGGIAGFFFHNKQKQKHHHHHHHQHSHQSSNNNNNNNNNEMHYGPLHNDTSLSQKKKRRNSAAHHPHHPRTDLTASITSNSNINKQQQKQKHQLHRYPPRPDDSRYYTAADNIGDALNTVLQSANNSFFFHPLQSFGISPPIVSQPSSPLMLETTNSVTSSNSVRNNHNNNMKALNLNSVDHYHEDSEEDANEHEHGSLQQQQQQQHKLTITCYNEKQEDKVEALLFQLRQQLRNLHKQKKENTKKIETITPKDHILVTMSINIISIIGALLLPGIVSVVAFLGGICSSSLCFIFPALYRWELHKQGYAPFILKTKSEKEKEQLLALKEKEEGEKMPLLSHNHTTDNIVNNQLSSENLNQHNTNYNNQNYKHEMAALMERPLSAPPKPITNNNNNNNNNNKTNYNNNNNHTHSRITVTNTNTNNTTVSGSSSLHVVNYNSTGTLTRNHLQQQNHNHNNKVESKDHYYAEEEYNNNNNNEEEGEEETNRMEYVLTLVMFLFGLGGGILGTAVAVKVYFFS